LKIIFRKFLNRIPGTLISRTRNSQAPELQIQKIPLHLQRLIRGLAYIVLVTVASCATAPEMVQKQPIPPLTLEKPAPPEEAKPPEQPLPKPPAPSKTPKPGFQKPSFPFRPDKTRAEEDKYITLNFSDADLEIVLQTISERLGMNYILGPKIKGNITIQTYKKIPREDLRSVLNSVLEVNGFTTVESGHYVKVVPIAQAKQYPIETRIGKDEDEISAEDIAVTQIIQLDYIAANEIAKLIKPLISRAGTLITHEPTNIMILNEVSSNIKRLLKIINLLDVPTQLESGEQIFVYYVENAEADKLANTLNSVYKVKKKGAKSPVTFAKKTDPLQYKSPAQSKAERARAKAKAKIKAKAAKKGEGVAAIPEEAPVIVADKEINALIIKTTPRIYRSVLELVKKLDILPKQVLIEVLIADITLSDDFKFGISWSLADSVKNKGERVITESFGAIPKVGGVVFYTIESLLGEELWKAELKAQADKGNVNILSSPHLLTSDNKEASISIGQQRPVASTTYGTGGTTGISTSSVQFKDIGIKLNVTPNINEKGLVAMKIAVEVSDVGEPVETGDRTEFAYIKRDVQTSVVVKSGQTLVLGGLISENRGWTRTGIPFLMDIPYLGYFFGATTETLTKTELVMLITPRVIGTLEEARELTDEFQKNVDALRQEMGKDD